MLKLDRCPEACSYRAAYVPDDDAWHVLDPLRGAICCASTKDRADEVVRWLMVTAREREDRAAFAC